MGKGNGVKSAVGGLALGIISIIWTVYMMITLLFSGYMQYSYYLIVFLLAGIVDSIIGICRKQYIVSIIGLILNCIAAMIFVVEIILVNL